MMASRKRSVGLTKIPGRHNGPILLSRACRICGEKWKTNGHTVTPAFFEAYTSQPPLRPGYEFRRLFYWLNTHMIHVWLFGDQQYHDRVASVAAEIVAQL